MKVVPLSFAAAALMAAAPVVAQDAVPQNAANAKPAKVKKSCRSMTVTGRRIASSECHTAEQWALIDKENAERAKSYIDNVQSQAGRYEGERGPMGTTPGIGGM